MNKEAIFEAVDGFIEAVCNEQTACAESILEAVGQLPTPIKGVGLRGNLQALVD